MKLIIIDALRYDVATDPKIMPNLNEKMNVQPIHVVANQTEPSIASMLTGKYPHQHGYTSLGQLDGEEIIQKYGKIYPSYHMYSPSDQFKSMMGSFQRIAFDFKDMPDPYCHDVPTKPDRDEIIHIMDVHDYYHSDQHQWMDFYNGYEPLVEEEDYMLYSLHKAPGWKPLWMMHTPTDNAGKLKAIYKNSAHQVDKWIGELLRTGEKIIVTADHGEGFGEKGVAFRHMDVYDFMVKVVLATNFDVPKGKLLDHTDIYRLLNNVDIPDRKYTYCLENTWQTRYRITNKIGNYCIKNGKHMIYKRPDIEGVKSMLPRLEAEFADWKEKKPFLLHLHSSRIQRLTENYVSHGNFYKLDLKPNILEIGGGKNPLPFPHTNMDISDSEKVDVKHDLEVFPYPFKDNSFVSIYSAYCIEHLSWRTLPKFIKEIKRILIPGGKAIFLAPNTLQQCKKIVEEGINKDNIRMLFGKQEFPNHAGAHKTGFSPEYAKKLFEEHGFKVKPTAPMPTITYNNSYIYPKCKTDMIIEATVQEKTTEDIWIPTEWGKKPKNKMLKVTIDPDKKQNIFDNPEYWNGELGYRSPGYQDFPINQKKVEYILKKGIKGPVLDVGCAHGYIVKRLREKGINAWGIDISKYAIDHAPEDIKQYLRHADATDIPFPDKTFDMAVSFSTLEHIPTEKIEETIKEITRVAKRGIISVTPGDDPHFNEDPSHVTKKPLEWWWKKFPKKFEIIGDSDEKWNQM